MPPTVPPRRIAALLLAIGVTLTLAACNEAKLASLENRFRDAAAEELRCLQSQSDASVSALEKFSCAAQPEPVYRAIAEDSAAARESTLNDDDLNLQLWYIQALAGAKSKSALSSVIGAADAAKQLCVGDRATRFVAECTLIRVAAGMAYHERLARLYLDFKSLARPEARAEFTQAVAGTEGDRLTQEWLPIVNNYKATTDVFTTVQNSLIGTDTAVTTMKSNLQVMAATAKGTRTNVIGFLRATMIGSREPDDNAGHPVSVCTCAAASYGTDADCYTKPIPDGNPEEMRWQGLYYQLACALEEGKRVDLTHW